MAPIPAKTKAPPGEQPKKDGRGGYRPGAGRKKGSDAPGRGPDKAKREARERAAALGETPLEYMCRIMNSAGVKASRRDDMAKAAAPYMHNRLQAVTHSGDDKNPVRLVTKVRIVAASAEDAATLAAEGEPKPSA